MPINTENLTPEILEIFEHVSNQPPEKQLPALNGKTLDAVRKDVGLESLCKILDVYKLVSKVESMAFEADTVSKALGMAANDEGVTLKEKEALAVAGSETCH